MDRKQTDRKRERRPIFLLRIAAVLLVMTLISVYGAGNAVAKYISSDYAQEQARVANGEGTRNWTVEQQKELLETGRVSGFEGHHMLCCQAYTEQAGNPDNIQFLTHEEHIDGAHQGDSHRATNGYYDYKTETIHEGKNGEVPAVPTQELSDKYIDLGSFQEEGKSNEMSGEESAKESKSAGAAADGGESTDGGGKSSGQSMDP